MLAQLGAGVSASIEMERSYCETLADRAAEALKQHDALTGDPGAETDDEAAADAALIEAAPELLAAREDALEEINAFRRAIPIDQWPDKPVVHTSTRDKVVAAIAKAKGGAA